MAEGRLILQFKLGACYTFDGVSKEAAEGLHASDRDEFRVDLPTGQFFVGSRSELLMFCWTPADVVKMNEEEYEARSAGRLSSDKGRPQ